MRLRATRVGAGLTQAELAQRAGVSRQLVGAVEAGRHLPRVDAAVALARALGIDVAALFADEPAPVDVVTGAPPADGSLVRTGIVGELTVSTPVGALEDGWGFADAVVEAGAIVRFEHQAPGIVVAGCEPGLPLLERMLRAGGMGAVAVGASSAAARAALAAGRVHAAVVHGVSPEAGVPGDVVRFGLATWQVGLAASPDAPSGWVDEALSGAVAVVQREKGAGVQAAFDRAARTPVPGPRVSSHVAAVRRGLDTGTPAVTIEPAAIALGARFHPFETHVAQLWIAPRWLGERGVTEALNVVTGRGFQRRLAAVGGYDLTGCGVRVA